MTLQIHQHDWESIASSEQAWADLVARQPFADPTRHLAWLRAWWLAYGGVRRRRELLLSVERAGVLVAAAPLMIESLPGGARVLRHLGTSPHWFAAEPLVAPGDDEARRALVTAIAAVPADLVVLEDLPCGDRLLAELERQLPRGVRRDQGEALYRYRESSPPDLRRRRRQSRQRTRSLERAGRRVAVAVTEDRGEVLGALPALCDLVERVWRGRGDGSGITHPAGRAYLHQAVATAPRGAILLTRVMVDGRLAAFDLALREGRSGVMFRGNWDADSGASGVGWISMLTTLDALRDAGVTTIDFGKFGWEYKRALTSEPRTALVTFAISRGVRGAFALGLWRARPALLAARAKVGALGERLALRLRRPRA